MTITLNNKQDFYDWQNKAILETGASSYHRFTFIGDLNNDMTSSQWLPTKYPCELKYEIELRKGVYNIIFDIYYNWD